MVEETKHFLLQTVKAAINTGDWIEEKQHRPDSVRHLRMYSLYMAISSKFPSHDRAAHELDDIPQRIPSELLTVRAKVVIRNLAANN